LEKEKKRFEFEGNSGIEPEAGLEPATLRYLIGIGIPVKSHTLYLARY
jgi:hypothetical protein